MSITLKYEVLEQLRQKGPLSVREVHEGINQNRQISLNAVATALNRLVKQGLITRSGTMRNYQYQYAPSDTAIRKNAENTAKSLLSEAGEAGLVHFIDAIDKIHPQSLAKLEDLLAQRRNITNSIKGVPDEK